MPTNITLDQARDMLGYLVPSGHEYRVKIGAALNDEFPGDDGRTLFLDWCATGPNHDESEARAVWKSFKPGKGIGIGTLVKEAKAAGFQFRNDQAPPPSPAELAERERRRAEAIQASKREDAERRSGAAERTATEFENAIDHFPGPTYLTAKGVNAFGVRFRGDGTMLVPVRGPGGQWRGLQTITPKGSKKFVRGTQKAGSWHLIGEPADVILIAEGYATAASLHMATGHPVAVAFDAGNLKSVSQALRLLYRTARLVLCADDDRDTQDRTGKNTGIDAAREAAKAVQGFLAIPEGLPEGGGDFNDLHLASGLEAVRRCIESSLQAKVSEPESRPAVGSDPFTVDEDGVWFHGHDKDGNELRPEWVCTRLEVEALTRNSDGGDWGYLLTFADPLHRPKTWAMPARMLSGDGNEMRAMLLSMGLRIAPSPRARLKLTEYIQTRYRDEVALCVDRVGWHGPAYVLPTETLGDEGERVVYQVDGPLENHFRQRGSAEQWADRVARLCVGNSRLAFAVCCAFAGPMMRPAGMESGGFHLRGDSSSGKTTALRVAASVYGAPTYMQRWRATDNALEAIASQHCDGLLILDELAQVDPRVAGETAYLLANESAKARATRTGAARSRKTWRLLFLSAGELGLADHMAEGGKRVRAGQEARMADIPADAGRGLGAFENLHEIGGGSEFSRHITQAASACYGATGRAWLQWLVEHANGLRQRVKSLADQIELSLVPELASGQVQRVGARFILVAAAGELATEAGLTGWPEGEATRAARACFNAWMAARGGIGNSEVAHMLNQVRRFLELHGEGRFTFWHRGADDHAAKTLHRAGVRRMLDERDQPIKTQSGHLAEYGDRMPPTMGEHVSVEFFILADVFKTEVCQGFDHVAVCKVLLDHGCLVTKETGRYDVKPRLPGIGPARCYHITPKIFEVEA